MPNEGFIIFKSSGHRSNPARAKTLREIHQERLAARPEQAQMDRAKLATRQEKAQAGIDWLTKGLMDDARRAGEALPSETKARAEAQAVAERVERKRD